MKLAAIYNVWDSEELLVPSMRRMADEVDLFIIVYQVVSNYGEEYSPLDTIVSAGLMEFNNIRLARYTPKPGQNPGQSERDKRNLGIFLAKEHNCTHFLHLDCDEFYKDFRNAKRQYISSGNDGSVCMLHTYFKKPTLRLEGIDNYYVPFIHKLHKKTQAGVGNYPFYVDPTRKINTHDVALIQEPMHHMSWVRKDIKRKVRNSTARYNIERSQLLKDYMDPNTGPGTILKDYQGQKLIEVEDIFNLGPLFGC